MQNSRAYSSKSKLHTQYKLKDGTLVPGVTTVIKKEVVGMALAYAAVKLTKQGINFKEHWDWLRDIGSLTHSLILTHINSHEPDTTKQYSQEQNDVAGNCFRSYLEWEKNHDIKPIICEQPLVSEWYRFGGTPDLFGYVDGILTLVDFKTGKAIYDSVWYQIAGYKILIEENKLNGNSYKVDRAIVLNIGRDNSEKFLEGHMPSKDHPDFNEHETYFLTQLDAYYIEKGIERRVT